MGAAESVPNPDNKTLAMMEVINIGVPELAVFWAHFRTGDKELAGSIDIDMFYTLFHVKRSIFGDGIFELVDIHLTDEIDFGEYLTAVVTYCLFEPPEILRFCFYIFDRDKNGYIEKDEIMLFLRVIYHIVPPDDFDGNTRSALEKIDWNADGKVSWDEFNEVHRLFPALFFPAFRIQQNMIVETMGQRWWDKKKRYLYEEKVRKEMIDQLTVRKEHMRLVKLREKRVRKKMGFLRYFCCPAQRATFRNLFPIDDAEAEQKLSEAEAAQQRARQREIERRIMELNARNPETAAWKEYQARNVRREYAKLTKDPHERGKLTETHRAHRAEKRRASKRAVAAGE